MKKALWEKTLAACLAVLLASGNVPLQYAQAAKEYFR
jgi:uncharacterized membrane protein